MNHLAARQRASDGRWDYTSANRRSGTHALGYCSGWREATLDTLIAQHGEATGTVFYENQERRRAQQHKYHTTGHDTAEQACACYADYLLDNALFLDLEYQGMQRKCQMCGNWTNGFARVGYGTGYTFDLCAVHRTRGAVAMLLVIGESWES